jgi:hypothetical protein
MAGGRSGVLVTDYNGIVRELRKIDPETLKWMRRESKALAKDLQTAVRDSIPNTPPLSGMRPEVIPGRVTWGTGKPAKSVLIQTPRTKSKSAYRSIVRIAVQSAGTVLADMAGASGKYNGARSRTRVYKYSRSKTGSRWHSLTPQQGLNFAMNLDKSKGVKQNHASRFVWPAAEQALPAIVDEGQKIVDHAINVINSRMNK